MRVSRIDGPDAPGPASIVTGAAWVRGISRPAAPSRLVVEEVTFAPGSFTMWHSHPHGQLVLVTGGNGWLQARGEPATPVSTGDVVWLDPGEEHWHGSRPDAVLRHLIVQEHDEGPDALFTSPLTADEYPPQAHTNSKAEFS